MRFRIKYENRDGSQGTHDLEERNVNAAKQTFSNYYASKIISVENLTAKDNAFKVANIFLSSGKFSSDPRFKQISMFAKPAAALAEQLLDQYHHIVSGEQLDDVEHMAREIWQRVVSK